MPSSSDGFPTPYDRFEGEVRPEWIDRNGHMNLAYYTVLFDSATDMMFEALDFGIAYRERTNQTKFAAETHTHYERELLVDEKVRVAIQILHADDKRLHLAHEMCRLDTGEQAATFELLYLHVSLVERRVTPFPPDLHARVHSALTLSTPL